jgi:1-deoxy-D-xylulose-5-phosphate reductoisomerase
MKQNSSMIILGATGSVGQQAADVARMHGVRVDALSANSSVAQAESLVREFLPGMCAMADERAAADLAVRVKDLPVRVLSGQQGICEMIAETDSSSNDQIVENSIVGEAGLKPTVATLSAGKKLALANKESLVVGGDAVMALAREKGIEILPVDSEHCAIFQCLRSGKQSEIKNIILTASGGPFFGYSKDDLKNATLE